MPGNLPAPDPAVTHAAAALRGFAKPNLDRPAARRLLALWHGEHTLTHEQREAVIARFLAGPGEHTRTADPAVDQAVAAILDFAAPDPGMLVTVEMAEGCLRMLNRPLTGEQVDHVLGHFPRTAR